MARLFLSTSLGLALAFSSASGAFAVTTATDLVSKLQGTGVNASFVATAESSCAAGAASQCILALQALLRALPADLPASLVAEVADYVATTAGSRPDVAASPALISLNQTLASLGAGQVTGAVTPTLAGNDNPGGGTTSPPPNDGPASAGAP